MGFSPRDTLLFIACVNISSLNCLIILCKLCDRGFDAVCPESVANSSSLPSSVLNWCDIIDWCEGFSVFDFYVLDFDQASSDLKKSFSWMVLTSPCPPSSPGSDLHIWHVPPSKWWQNSSLSNYWGVSDSQKNDKQFRLDEEDLGVRAAVRVDQVPCGIITFCWW